MKYLKYVAIVAGVVLVALLAVLSLNIPWEGKVAPVNKAEISLPQGLSSNALKQSAPLAGDEQFAQRGYPAERDLTGPSLTIPIRPRPGSRTPTSGSPCSWTP